MIAIDPGVNIGLAMRETDGTLNLHTTREPDMLWDLLKVPKIEGVIVEKFATAGRLSKYGLYTIEIVGGVKALCYSMGIPLWIQIPQFRYRMLTEARKYTKQADTHHAIDALAHLLVREDMIKRGLK